MIFSVSVASFALGAYQSSRGRCGAGRQRQRERAMAGGKYTWLHNKAKWRVLFLYPLTWISISISSAPSLLSLPSLPSLCPFLHLLKSPFARRKKNKQTSAIWNWPAHLLLCIYSCELTDTCWCFLRDTFSLRLSGMGVEGAVFPSHTVHTHRLALRRCAEQTLHRPHWHANIFTNSQTTAGSVWERPAVGLDMKPDGTDSL